MADYRDKSFWLSNLEIEPNPPVRGDQQCDVAIVGGGFTGLSTAYHLAEFDPSLDVRVLEKEVAGWGASGRNGGFSMTLFGLTLATTVLRYGRERTAEAHRYMCEAVSELREIVEREGIDCDYEHPGFLRVATSGGYERRLRKEMQLAEEMGLEGFEWLGADELAEEVRSPEFGPAIREHHCGLIDPAKQARGLKRVVEERGVEIREGTPVESIERDGEVRLQTPGGTVRAEKAVLATNGYSHQIDAIRRKQTPAFTYIVVTEPLEARHFEQIGWQNRQGIEDARNLIHYFRLTADDRLLMGGSDVGVAFGDDMSLERDPAVFDQLEADIATIFPSLADLEIEQRWGGPVSITVDMVPAIGHVGDERVVYSVGCMGHGVSLTHLNGKTIAEMILGRQTRRTDAFFVGRRVVPWPPEPLRYAAGQAVRGYMKLEDAVLERL